MAFPGLVDQVEPPVVSSSLLTRGAKLGRYELIDHLATGGMAELFLARTQGEGGFEKVVVLKRILPQLAQNADFVHMFLDEARLAALLHHPNIAQVFDIGQVGGSFFFVMEHVHGRDLRDVVRKAKAAGGMPLQHALAIVSAAAAGLHYAHEKRGPDDRSLHLVHRDVSPANLIVTFDGGVKLVDFGVAKARSRHAETRGGTLKGKIAYMSPEQCRGEPVDRRSDIFALGIVLYELTTGGRLFRGDNEFALLQQIATEDVPPPSLRRPDFPTGLEVILMRALARDKSHRYRTAEDLQIDLEEFAAEAKLKSTTIGLRRWMRSLFPDAVPPPASTSDMSIRPSQVLQPARLPEGTPVRDQRPVVTAPLALPLRAPPDSVVAPLPKPLTKEEAIAKMPAWLAAELFPAPAPAPAPVVEPAPPTPVVEKAKDPTPPPVRPAATVPLVPTRAPTSATERGEKRKLTRRLAYAASGLALATAVLAIALALRAPAQVAAPAAAPAPAAVPAPAPAPAPPAPALGLATSLAADFFGERPIDEVVAAIHATAAEPERADKPEKRKRSRHSTKKSKNFWGR